MPCVLSDLPPPRTDVLGEETAQHVERRIATLRVRKSKGARSEEALYAGRQSVAEIASGNADCSRTFPVGDPGASSQQSRSAYSETAATPPSPPRFFATAPGAATPASGSLPSPAAEHSSGLMRYVFTRRASAMRLRWRTMREAPSAPPATATAAEAQMKAPVGELANEASLLGGRG